MNVVLAVSGPIFGLLTLKFHPIRIMIFGAILAAIGFFGTAIVATLPTLIIFLGIFFGLGASALCYSIVYAAAVPVIGEKRSALFGGLLSASQGALSMLFAPLLQVGSNSIGMTGCLVGIGIVTLCLIPLCILFLPKKTKNTAASPDIAEPSKPSVSLRNVLKFLVTQPFFYMMAFGMFTYGFCDGGMINHLFEFAQLFNASESFSAMLVSIYSCSSMVGAILGGIICAKFADRKLSVAVTYGLWAIVVYISYWLPAGMATGLILTISCGILTGMSLPLFAAIAQSYVSIEKFAAVFSILYFFIIIAYSIDSVLGGILYDIFHSFEIVDYLALVLSMLTALVFFTSVLIAKRTNRKITRF